MLKMAAGVHIYRDDMNPNMFPSGWQFCPPGRNSSKFFAASGLQIFFDGLYPSGPTLFLRSSTFHCDKDAEPQIQDDHFSTHSAYADDTLHGFSNIQFSRYSRLLPALSPLRPVSWSELVAKKTHSSHYAAKDEGKAKKVFKGR